MVAARDLNWGPLRHDLTSLPLDYLTSISEKALVGSIYLLLILEDDMDVFDIDGAGSSEPETG